MPQELLQKDFQKVLRKLKKYNLEIIFKRLSLSKH